jgi:hypothetical protein
MLISYLFQLNFKYKTEVDNFIPFSQLYALEAITLITLDSRLR